MWIRSQNKSSLAKANKLLIEKTNDKYSIVQTDAVNPVIKFFKTIGTTSTVIRLGTYETEERAIEVLDQIQDFISCDGEMNDCKFRVFKMPKE
ncbi:hypothetical protein [Brassicibacter mesophilus]|uniref:hypothetical protein n=1 Tax=Brassicibacter mesophilus TaxID=745119 RepID=UPI003D19A10B